MVQAVTPHAQIDGEIIYLIASWEDLEEVLAFDAESRLNYAVDWPVVTMADERLQSLIAQHGLTPAQRERYDHLRALQTQNAPLLAQLLNC